MRFIEARYEEGLLKPETHDLLVAMTGYGQPEDRRRSHEAGIHHHFRQASSSQFS